MTARIAELAIAAVAFLTSCLDAPSAGHVYECDAVFVCDGQPYELSTAHGCAGSLEDALELYRASLDELVKDAKCSEQHFEMTSCSATAELCTY